MDGEERQASSFIVGFALGVLVGAGVALLMAPQSGRRTRRVIVRAAEDLGDNARDTFEDASVEARRAARDAVRSAERRGARLREATRRARGRPGR